MPSIPGGWNMLFANLAGPDVAAPMGHYLINARGSGGWFGWPEDTNMDELRDAFARQRSPRRRCK
jgi:peptide/nickel transport system substrate-binding protein